MAEIKICGMKDPANILDVAALKPEYLGFICWSGSPRFVGDAFSLPVEIGDSKRVGVFVNQDLREIERWIDTLSLSVLQLHGDEDASFCGELKKRHPGLEVWKVFAVFDSIPTNISQFRKSIDRVLFDTKSPVRGGSGVTFSWDVLKQYAESFPVVLSGGLGVENAAAAHELCRVNRQVSAVDFNSCLESAPGSKDVALVKKVIEIIRGS